MKKFYNPLEPTQGKSTRWTPGNASPSYDERSSVFVKAGVDYGVGKDVPIGSKEGKASNALPSGAFGVDIEK